MIVGTAGHIDHGKTSLVKALTGVDADRLQEEKARGITLDLGYAYQAVDAADVLGFVDVPGHEKLIHNMLAGATGIDHVLLVVAADDGPMPQTREHLEILDLLGLDRGTVALTKIDRVPSERAAAVASDIAALLAGGGLADAPVFPVSSQSGAGVDALRAHLHTLARDTEPRPTNGRFRLAVDRCFTLAGTGTVVTGTVHSGRVRIDDRVLLSPAGIEVRVRGIHAQNQPAQEGVAGQRCALNLVGAGLEKKDVRRGDWIIDADLHRPTQRIDAELRVPPHLARPLRHWTPVHVHIGAADISGRVAVLEGDAVAAGETALVQLVLDQPTVALHGDRFVLRDQSARQTLAGGRVLDNAPPTRGRRTPQRLACLHALRRPTASEALHGILPAAGDGFDLDRFARLWNLEPDAMQALRTGDGMRCIDTPTGGVAFAPENWDALRTRVPQVLAEEHARHPDRLGPDKERLRRLVRPSLARPVFAAMLDELAQTGAIAISGPWVHLPDHEVRLSSDEDRLWRDEIRPLLDAQPYNPPRVRDVANALGIEEDDVRRLMRQLTGMGELHRVAHDHYFTQQAVTELAAIARELTELEGAALASAFRDRIGTGRKVAIHILEFFDRIGYSRRIGDEHRVFRDSLLEGR
ncbi:MAG: selenocysteine-specific translation elongation factor [Ectothiorhodospiraceae bacterium]|jgi:selenocysteine-specific elongation factor|nr:selenocysteine-specific translation elongation factor [Ectothiorhodospiraceae bacterium]